MVCGIRHLSLVSVVCTSIISIVRSMICGALVSISMKSRGAEGCGLDIGTLYDLVYADRLVEFCTRDMRSGAEMCFGCSEHLI